MTNPLVDGMGQTLIDCSRELLKPNELCLEDVPQGASVLWVDARTRREYQAGHVPGALLWSLEPGEDDQAFEAQALERMVQSTIVVVYCASAGCGTSHQVAERLRALGLGIPVKVLYGGWHSARALAHTRS